MVCAMAGAVAGSRKSSHGFASDTTLMLMLCWVMKARFTAREE